MGLTIRPAETEDLSVARYIGFATWPATYGSSRGAGYVVRGLDGFWNEEAIGAAITSGGIDVADTARGVVGMVQVEELGEDLVMWKLYVLPLEQGAGVGRALVQSAKRRAQAQSCDLLTEYDLANAAVRGFYEREGFAPTAAPWPTDGAIWLRWRDPARRGVHDGPQREFRESP